MTLLLQLPDIRGTEATQRIRAIEREAPSESSMVILGLTGSVDADNLAEYAKAGMNGCIMKGKLLGDALNQAMAKLENAPDTFVTALGDGRRKESPKGKVDKRKVQLPLQPAPLAQEDMDVDVDVPLEADPRMIVQAKSMVSVRSLTVASFADLVQPRASARAVSGQGAFSSAMTGPDAGQKMLAMRLMERKSIGGRSPRGALQRRPFGATYAAPASASAPSEVKVG